MNRDEHIIIGCFIGTIASAFLSIYLDKFNFIYFLIFVMFSAFGSIIPDIIEPPHSWTHRNFFHSQVILGVLSFTLFILFFSLILGNQSILTYLTSGFLLGYVSHLLADATTRIGLPKY